MDGRPNRGNKAAFSFVFSAQCGLFLRLNFPRTPIGCMTDVMLPSNLEHSRQNCFAPLPFF